MIRRIWRKLWCRLLGHAYRPLVDGPKHPAHWWCIRCGFLPYTSSIDGVHRYTHDAGRGVVWLEQPRADMPTPPRS